MAAGTCVCWVLQTCRGQHDRSPWPSERACFRQLCWTLFYNSSASLTFFKKTSDRILFPSLNYRINNETKCWHSHWGFYCWPRMGAMGNKPVHYFSPVWVGRLRPLDESSEREGGWQREGHPCVFWKWVDFGTAFLSVFWHSNALVKVIGNCLATGVRMQMELYCNKLGAPGGHSSQDSTDLG